MRRPVVLAGDKAQINTVELGVCGPGRPAAAGRRMNIQGDHRLVVSSTFRQAALPLHEERHANASFQHLAFVTLSGSLRELVLVLARRCH